MDLLFGLLAGALGAAIWAGITVVSGYEIGWIAWAVGGLVGWAVALGNRSGSRPATVAGGIAVAITVLSIIGGKYAAVVLMTPSDAEIIEMFGGGFDDREYVISFVADEVVDEFEVEGQMLEWPSGVDPSNARAEVDYPVAVWSEAAARWARWTESEQDAFRSAKQTEVRANVEAGLPEIRAAIASGGFFGSFTPMDLIFFGLAMITAFGVGSGRKSQEQVATEYATAARGVLIRMMLADGVIEETEVAAVVAELQELVGIEFDPEEIRNAAASTIEFGDPIRTLEGVASQLTDQGKQGLVRAALAVAIADGAVAPEERDLVEEIARAVGMSQEDLHAVLAEATKTA